MGMAMAASLQLQRPNGFRDRAQSSKLPGHSKMSGATDLSRMASTDRRSCLVRWPRIWKPRNTTCRQGAIATMLSQSVPCLSIRAEVTHDHHCPLHSVMKPKPLAEFHISFRLLDCCLCTQFCRGSVPHAGSRATQHDKTELT